jgi:hypothetical protein
MTIDGAWVPETEEEMRLMEDLHRVTRRAHADGVERHRIAALQAFMASAALDPKAAEETDVKGESPVETLRERMEAEAEDVPDDADVVECPDCGTPVETFITGVGMESFHLKPCGCDVGGREDTEQLYERLTNGDTDETE